VDEFVEDDIENEAQDIELANLGARLKTLYREYKDARRDIEDEWLMDLRQYNGQYEPDVIARLDSQGARSKVFVGLTRTKVMAAYSRIVDLMFQASDTYFGIRPTPRPTIDPMKAMQMRQQAMQEVAAASGMPTADGMNDLVTARMEELEPMFLDAEKQIAEEASKEMTIDILDQLTEANADQKIKSAIMEACIFGSGAIKSGTVSIDRSQSYSKVVNEMGESGFTLSMIEKVVPDIESVSIFDLYPDPYCTNLRDCDGLFRRHILTKRQLRELKDLPGFDSEEIEEVIRTQRKGDHTEETHERTRREISGVNDQGESRRYEVLEYWGCIDGQDLQDYGVDLDEDTDLTQQFDSNVWLLSGKVIKIQLNPVMGYKIPYQIFPYERSPHQFWGTGVPKMMRDSQSTMNAATRIYLDNMALSSGPMLEVNSDLLAAGEDPTDIHPWRVFLREGGDGTMPAVRFFQPIANANGLTSIIDIFRRFADETTSLPSYTHGEQTKSLNKTATGISMLMGAANVALKSTIKNLDDFLVRPMVESLFHFNMQYGTNEKSKGDLKVIARGSTALIQKEVQSQRLLQFMSLLGSPEDQMLVNRPQLLKQIAESMDIDPEAFMKSEEEINAEIQQQQAQQQQMLLAASQGNQSPDGNAGMAPPNGVM
jgi:hypothetical protein